MFNDRLYSHKIATKQPWYEVRMCSALRGQLLSCWVRSYQVMSLRPLGRNHKDNLKYFKLATSYIIGSMYTSTHLWYVKSYFQPQPMSPTPMGIIAHDNDLHCGDLHDVLIAMEPFTMGLDAVSKCNWLIRYTRPLKTSLLSGTLATTPAQPRSASAPGPSSVWLHCTHTAATLSLSSTWQQSCDTQCNALPDKSEQTWATNLEKKTLLYLIKALCNLKR